MSKHILAGLIVGGIFALVILYGAVSTAIPAGGMVLLAAAVNGLAAGLCIGGLIAANFALAAEEEKKKEATREPTAELPIAA